jgi:dolichol-phosphate mannosyltransferase
MSTEAQSLEQRHQQLSNDPWSQLFVVPAFNEEDNLPRLLDDLGARPHLFPAGSGSRLLLVDDGSTDGTADVVRRYRGRVPVELLELGRNQGPGAAFSAGFARALALDSRESLVVTLEADTTSDLDALPAMLARVRAGADLVLASVHGGGRMLNVSPARRLMSAGAGIAMRHALGLDARTVSSFFRVYRGSLLRRALALYGDDLIRERGFACKAELLAKLVALGALVEEVPVDLDGSRRVGASKMPIARTTLAYWRLMVRARVPQERMPA